jgi:hypothetical protein
MVVAAARPVPVEQADPRLLVPGDHAGNYNKIASAFQRVEKGAGKESLSFYTDKRSFEMMEAAQKRQAERVGKQTKWAACCGVAACVSLFVAFLFSQLPKALIAALSVPVALSILGASMALSLAFGIAHLVLENRKQSSAEDLGDHALAQMQQRHLLQMNRMSNLAAAQLLQKYFNGSAEQKQQAIEEARAILSQKGKVRMPYLFEAAEFVAAR